MHIVPVSTYLRVFLCLLGLALLTVLAASADLGPLNTPIALGIAFVQAALVILFFMHVRYSGQLTWVFAGAGFLWLFLLLVLTLSDYLTRGWDGLPPFEFLK